MAPVHPAVGQGPTATISTSSDGVTWTAMTGVTWTAVATSRTTVLGASATRVLFGGGRWVALGENTLGHAIAYSDDAGSTWTAATGATTTFGVLPSSGDQTPSLAYAGVGRWFATANNQALTSADGAVWTNATGAFPPGATSGFKSVAFRRLLP